MTWLQITISNDNHTLEFIEEAFTDAGAVSVTVQDKNNTEAIFEIYNQPNVLWHHVNVIGLFEHTCNVDDIQSILMKKLNLTEPVLIEILEDQEWKDEWQKYRKPLRIGERLLICPDTNNKDVSDSHHIIRIDSGMAFGTGIHPTTQLCLMWLEKNIIYPVNFVDYGCGSGILAIAACKLGAKKIWAIDVDPIAIETTQKNVAINQCCSLNFKVGNIDMLPNQGTIDVLVANILAEPLMSLCENFANLLKPGGNLILSGILRNHLDSILITYSFLFENFNITYQEEWCCISAQLKD